MTYILNRFFYLLLLLVVLTGSSCSSLLNMPAAKPQATASRPPKQNLAIRPVQPAVKKAVRAPIRKVSAVKSPVVASKASVKQQPIANRTEVPLKATRQPKKNTD